MKGTNNEGSHYEVFCTPCYFPTYNIPQEQLMSVSIAFNGSVSGIECRASNEETIDGNNLRNNSKSSQTIPLFILV